MALSDILAAMKAEVEAQIQGIAAQTRADVAQVRRAAEEETQAIRERHRQEMLAVLQHERARRLNRARLGAVRAVSAARENLFAESLAAARGRLSEIRAQPDYASLLRGLADEALAHIVGEAVLHADPRDEQILRAQFPDARLAFDLQTWGGVEARTSDERIVVVNTLEARLERADELLRQEVMPLFSAAG
jgi:vacuolar-type H+-ATPase subunit E/Vma4